MKSYEQNEDFESGKNFQANNIYPEKVIIEAWKSRKLRNKATIEEITKTLYTYKQNLAKKDNRTVWKRLKNWQRESLIQRGNSNASKRCKSMKALDDVQERGSKTVSLAAYLTSACIRRSATEGKTVRCSRGRKRTLLRMNLHEYIDIPLE